MENLSHIQENAADEPISPDEALFYFTKSPVLAHGTQIPRRHGVHEYYAHGGKVTGGGRHYRYQVLELIFYFKCRNDS